MVYKVIDLFAGVGGLSYGFAHDSNFQIIAANEILKPMAIAYSLNHPTVKVYNKDIKDFNEDEFINYKFTENIDKPITINKIIFLFLFFLFFLFFFIFTTLSFYFII